MVKFPARCARINSTKSAPEIPTIHFLPIDEAAKASNAFGWRGPLETEATDMIFEHY
jgi:hypothetical protein